MSSLSRSFLSRRALLASAFPVGLLPTSALLTA